MADDDFARAFAARKAELATIRQEVAAAEEAAAAKKREAEEAERREQEFGVLIKDEKLIRCEFAECRKVKRDIEEQITRYNGRINAAKKWSKENERKKKASILMTPGVDRPTETPLTHPNAASSVFSQVDRTPVADGGAGVANGVVIMKSRVLQAAPLIKDTTRTPINTRTDGVTTAASTASGHDFALITAESLGVGELQFPCEMPTVNADGAVAEPVREGAYATARRLLPHLTEKHGYLYSLICAIEDCGANAKKAQTYLSAPAGYQQHARLAHRQAFEEIFGKRKVAKPEFASKLELFCYFKPVTPADLKVILAGGTPESCAMDVGKRVKRKKRRPGVDLVGFGEAGRHKSPAQKKRRIEREEDAVPCSQSNCDPISAEGQVTTSRFGRPIRRKIICETSSEESDDEDSDDGESDDEKIDDEDGSASASPTEVNESTVKLEQEYNGDLIVEMLDASESSYASPAEIGDLLR